MSFFVYRRRIQFYETDAQGIVHHSNYFRLFEEARGEFLRQAGLPYRKLREEGYDVVLLEASCSFKKPLFYDDLVEVYLSLEEFKKYTFSFAYEVKVEADLKAQGFTRHCVVKNSKIVAIPQILKSTVEDFLQDTKRTPPSSQKDRF